MDYWEKGSYFIHGLLIGYSFVSYLIFPILSENKALIIFAILLFVGFNRFLNSQNRKACLKVLCVGIIIGYLFNIFFIYNDGVNIQYPPEYKEEYNKGKDVVLFVIPAYPSMYNQKNWSQIIRNSNELSEIQKKILSPFILNKYKNMYKRIGIDPSESISKQFIKEIENKFRNKEKDVYISYLNQKPILEEQIIEALQGGTENIYVFNVLLDQSEEWFEIQERIEKVRYYNYNTHIFYSNPFWESQRLKEMFIEKIDKESREENKKNTGIIFVGKGNENTLGSTFKEAVNQQTSFARGIKERLIKKGYEDKKIKIAFLNNTKYSIEKVLVKLLDQGISELIVVPIHIPFDNIDNKVIIPDKVKKVEIPSSIRIAYVPAWNVHPDFIEELYGRLKIIEETKLQKSQ